MTATVKLRELAERSGVSCSYRGWDGQEHYVCDHTLQAVLGALDIPAGSDEEIAASLEDVPNRVWRRMLPPSLVVVEGEHRTFPVHVPHGDPVEVWVVAEDGTEREAEQLDVWVEPRTVDDRLVGRATFAVPDLPPGWHTLRARSNDVEAAVTLVVTPARLAAADRLLQKRRWGVAAQVYSVRSSRSWGLGDFADLADLAAVTGAAYDGDFLLVNPVHAGDPRPPVEPSPYLPSSRRFADPLYVRVENIPETAYLPTKHRKRLDAYAAKFARANRKGKRLDRDATLRAKLDVLEHVYRVPRSASRQVAFETFRAEGGRALADFALWCALAEKFGDRPERWAKRAPSPDHPDTERLRAKLADRIDFHCWLQWVCDEQLATAQEAARTAGMDLGIVHDLAVGVRRNGADAWTLGDALATGVTVGAPPDDFNKRGQDWNQPPWRPDRLAELGYRPFRDVLRAALRHAGGLRVDHILGLFRTWWVPDGCTPDEGTYVRYDHEALVGILVLEAQRAGAVVIGEDLGVFEGWVQQYLAGRGVAGTSILWFEKDGHDPRPPESYRQLCLTSVTTHDLPPTAGYLAGDHVRLRSELGLLERDLDAELAEAEQERDAVLQLARDRGLLPPADPDDTEQDVADPQTVEALHRLIAASPSALLAVSLVDAVGERRSQNQPGTTDEYPNWRIPLADGRGRAVLLDDLAGSDRFAALAAAVRG
ncbi:4-alpha-glucanotransferase [Rhodococcus sp. NPDC003382]|uniref:4-alpha-glucanotransferase n=1 Tax=Rhodococcus sp. CX TaxID=2789880 RepID=UPI0018CF63DE|nr:4-alpha-glucanotransferase [Rhodococcus sp. CX]MBH0120436.1 4-alpha-glucanotransferase [Rhodococcus sp. CX]